MAEKIRKQLSWKIANVFLELQNQMIIFCGFITKSNPPPHFNLYWKYYDIIQKCIFCWINMLWTTHLWSMWNCVTERDLHSKQVLFHSASNDCPTKMCSYPCNITLGTATVCLLNINEIQLQDLSLYKITWEFWLSESGFGKSWEQTRGLFAQLCIGWPSFTFSNRL